MRIYTFKDTIVVDVHSRLVHITGGFWAVILFWAAWKRSWAKRDPIHSIIVADRSVAIIGDTTLAQLLIAWTIGPDRDINQRPFTTLIIVQANWCLSTL